MNNGADSPVQDSLKVLLEKGGIERVAIVDDGFDSMSQRGLSTQETNDLWGMLEFDEGFHVEMHRLGRKVDAADDLAGELIDELLDKHSEVPGFMEIWPRSIAGSRMTEARESVSGLRNQLENSLNLKVQTFGSGAEPSKLVTYDPQLLFLDWYLGDDGPQSVGGFAADGESHAAVQAAVDTARGILQDWPKERPKPLIILMSSKPGVETYAGEFCRRAEILRGMFYAVPKTVLNDAVNLRVYLSLFAMSVPAGRRLQLFMDTLREQFAEAEKQFLNTISDLTLTDYAYIQSLCLQSEGQPLGDYLLWLFSTYLGQLLFAEALNDVGSDLDSMTFEQALPSLGPPSYTLTDIYHTALFDTSVGPVEMHPLASAQRDSSSSIHPAIALGDVLRFQNPAADVAQDSGEGVHDHGDDKKESESDHGTAGDLNSDLLLVINAQCDLAFRPDSESSSEIEKSLAILLLPGALRPVGVRSGSASKPKTELYQENGQDYRIEWDTKNVETIPIAQFSEWAGSKGYERVARLRLPFALEIQRAFAADMTRIGSPVMPPIYQPIASQVLHPNSQDSTYEILDGLKEGEAAFLVLTRQGQQGVLTLPLIAKLKTLLEVKGVTMTEVDWTTLRSPFKMPTSTKALTFCGGRFRIELGAEEGQTCNSSIAVTLGLQTE